MLDWLFKARRGKKRRAAHVPGLLAVGTWWRLRGHGHRWLKTPAGHWGAGYHGCDLCGGTTYDDVDTFVPRLWPSLKDKSLAELDELMRMAV